MPYKDKEARRDYMRDYRKAKTVNPKDVMSRRGLIPVPFPVTPDGQDKPIGVTFVIPEEEGYTGSWDSILEKVRQHERGTQIEFTPSELKIILQWGIDGGKIKVRRKVADYHGLTQRYGPARLDKHELLDLLNGALKQEHKKWDTFLYYLGAVKPRQNDTFLYSME